ncbi:MAG: sodium:proton antiporter [Prevotella sp.]|nr:sodium:proton antiporter [Prevotella sp.]
MTLIIITILLLCYVLIATENVTNVNKAAVAIFAGAVGWVLYICYGTDYVMSQHPTEYFDFLNGASPTSRAVKEYIAGNVFLTYVGRASEVVTFLLATMAIVEILNNNGCFDFITQLLKTRSSQKMLWVLTGVTFLLSANLDNLTVTIMMLTMMHKVISNRRQRMIFGSAIVIAANMGGALTVIGDPTGLVLWNMSKVTATHFSMSLLIPCLIACVVPIWWIGRKLPERCDTEWITMPYRGDDTRLNVWQRLVMLFVGIGGLWFIPTFHNITRLSPFVGALCVLAVLWIVNEIFNHRLMNSEQMMRSHVPGIFQYGVVQMMLFVMGMMLAIGVVQETGVTGWLMAKGGAYVESVWLMGILSGIVSTVLDNFATAVSFFALSDAPTNDCCWMMIAYCTAVGGNILCVGSMGGLAFIKMERVHIGWYFRHVGWMSLIASLLGLAVFIIL